MATNTLRALLFAAVVTLPATGAYAAPLFNQAGLQEAVSLTENVKIVCFEDGRCYQKGRPPVARWVYGENNFSGPYVGPGYYGAPGHHTRWWWWPFGY